MIENGIELKSVGADTGGVGRSKGDAHALAMAGIGAKSKQRKESVLSNLVCIILFSYLGTLLRVGIETGAAEITDTLSYIYPQFIGTAVLGFISFFKPQITSISPGFYVGLSTGFCGTLTTFSSFLLDTLDLFLDGADPAVIVYTLFEVLLLGLSTALAALHFGRHIALGTEHCFGKEEVEVEVEQTCRALHKADVALLICSILSTCAVIVATVFYLSPLAFSLCFAPFGALLRWQLGRLNKIWEQFPLGTFIANVAGSIMIAIAEVVLDATGTKAPSLAFAISNGFQNGFCGCLTTVSTFVLELHTLKLHKAYIYGATSVAVAEVAVFIIIASYIWTR